jgi:hypothetical protein
MKQQEILKLQLWQKKRQVWFKKYSTWYQEWNDAKTSGDVAKLMAIKPAPKPPPEE